MHSPPPTLPVVAIIGKPNVGKSSLFNRLIHKRKAIVSDEPGVTRDINYEKLSSPSGDFLIADSAGLTDKAEDDLAKAQEFNRRLIEEASLIVFTCEAEGVDSEDRRIARIIRKSGKPCVLVVNKIDREQSGDVLYDFFELGMGEPIPVSAIHGTNAGILEARMEAELAETFRRGGGSETAEAAGADTGSPAEVGDADKIGVSVIGVAIVGKPNVGKSSLLNQLVGRERALVTPLPGTTRDTIDESISFGGRPIRLVDTAGLRRRGKIRESVEYYSLVRAEQAVRSSSISLLVLDSTEKVSIQDKKIASIVVREKKGLIVAANKWDLAEERGQTLKKYVEDLFFFFPHISFAEVVPISAKTGYNKSKLLEKILEVYDNYHRRIKTGELNALIRRFTLRGANIKYGFQKSSAPPLFEFFIGGSDARNRNYRRYILNSVRKCFDFTGVPVDVVFRKNS
jgi:GTP-binding protein